MDQNSTGYSIPSSSSSASSSSRQPGFDGPGARPILDGQGSASTTTTDTHPTDSSTGGPNDRSKMEAKSPTPLSEPRGTSSPGHESSAIKRVGGKANVSAACGPCKRAHLACDVARPCKRCVNMGKEDQCEDVPHKKRGRPKVPKNPLSEPYSRPRPSTSDSAGGLGRWRGSSQYDTHYISAVDAHNHVMGRTSPRSGGLQGEADASFSAASPSNQPFTLFTTTDFKVLRATHSCYPLIGYHPNEFVNLNLLDWIHPQDRHLLDVERARLLSVPYVEGQLRSAEVSQAAITLRSEMELLSPAEGMREPYPNKNVRVLHSDNRFSPFNVRLHLGGGLGASLWQPATLGRIYLVVSFLAIPRSNPYPPIPIPNPYTNDMNMGMGMGMGPPRRSSQAGPPTPITPISVPPMNQHPNPNMNLGLPGFSSIAAAADAPPTRYDQQPYLPPPPPPPPPPRPSSSSSRPMSSHSHSHSTHNMYQYPPSRSGSGIPSLPVPLTNTHTYPPYSRRSTSPLSAVSTSTSTYRAQTPQTATASYQMQLPAPVPSSDYPQPPLQVYHQHQHQSDRRDEDQWRNGNSRLPQPVGGVQQQQQHQQHQAPAGSGGDGSRRAWEL